MQDLARPRVSMWVKFGISFVTIESDWSRVSLCLTKWHFVIRIYGLRKNIIILKYQC